MTLSVPQWRRIIPAPRPVLITRPSLELWSKRAGDHLNSRPHDGSFVATDRGSRCCASACVMAVARRGRAGDRPRARCHTGPHQGPGKGNLPRRRRQADSRQGAASRRSWSKPMPGKPCRTFAASLPRATPARKKLRVEMDRADAELATHRTALEWQLRLAYATGREEWLRLALTQQDPVALSRRVVYYGYITRQRSTLLQQVQQEIESLRGSYHHVARAARGARRSRQAPGSAGPRVVRGAEGPCPGGGDARKRSGLPPAEADPPASRGALARRIDGAPGARKPRARAQGRTAARAGFPRNS